MPSITIGMRSYEYETSPRYSGKSITVKSSHTSGKIKGLRKGKKASDPYAFIIHVKGLDYLSSRSGFTIEK